MKETAEGDSNRIGHRTALYVHGGHRDGPKRNDFRWNLAGFRRALKDNEVLMARFYIGNLPHSATEVELQAWLEQQGFRVESVQVIRDLETGGSRGFGFAELPEVVRAKEAVDALNGQKMEGHNVRVSEARPVNLNTEGRQIAGTRTPKRRAS